MRLGERFRLQSQAEYAFEAFRRGLGALVTAQKGRVRFHKGRELANMGVARLDAGLLREAFRWLTLAFLEDCLSRAEDSPDVQDELIWPAAQFLRRFGMTEDQLAGLSTRTRARARKRLIKDPASVFVDEGFDAALARIPERAVPRTPGPIRVFVSSPGDLRPERILVADVCADLKAITGRDIRALLWEGAGPSHPESPPFPASIRGEPAQAIIDERLDRELGGYDVYIGMLWLRMGTPTGGFRSGTEAEFRYALRKFQETGQPKMLFYAKNARGSQVRQPGVDDFLNELGRHYGLPQRFRSSRDLRPMLVQHLGELLGGLP